MLDPAIINEMPAKSNFNKALSVFSLQQPNVWTKVEKAQTHIPEIIATIRGSIKKIINNMREILLTASHG